MISTNGCTLTLFTCNCTGALYEQAYPIARRADPARCPSPEQVRIAARTGFTHVGLRLLPATPTDPDYDMLGDTPAVRATLAALMETGIRVSDVEIVRLTPGFTLDDRLQRFMETAARLGAGQVLVAGNDDNLQRSADNLAILAAAGRPFGLTMNLEPMPGPSCATSPQRKH